MKPENHDTLQLMKLECGPYINQEIKELSKQYEGTNQQWATPEVAFKNATCYMRKTLVTESCHYYEGTIAWTIWKDKLTKFKEIINNKIQINLNWKKFIEGHGYEYSKQSSKYSKLPIHLNNQDVFEGLPFYIGVEKAIEIMENAMSSNIENWETEEKALIILNRFQQEYECVLKNNVHRYVYFNILLPRYGISEPRPELEIPDEEYIFIQQQKYNFFQKIIINEYFPKEAIIEIESLVLLEENIAKSTSIFETRRLLIDFQEKCCLEETKKLTHALIDKLDTSITLEHSSHDLSLVKQETSEIDYDIEETSSNKTNYSENHSDEQSINY